MNNFSKTKESGSFLNMVQWLAVSILFLVCTNFELSPNMFSLVNIAYADSLESTSTNSLIRRPSLSTGHTTQDKDSTVEERSEPIDQKKEANVSSTQTSSVAVNPQLPNTQNTTVLTEKGDEVETSSLLSSENKKETDAESKNLGKSIGVTHSATLPIYSTAPASSPKILEGSATVTGAISPANGITRQGTQPAPSSSSSRKLTQRPGIERINSFRTVRPKVQVSPQSPIPSPAPSPAPTKPTPVPPDPLYSITLTWSPNSDPDLAGYKVYRKTSAGAPYTTPIGTIRGNITTFHSTNLQKGTTYYYVVTAFDQLGNESAFSNEVSQSIF